MQVKFVPLRLAMAVVSDCRFFVLIGGEQISELCERRSIIVAANPAACQSANLSGLSLNSHRASSMFSHPIAWCHLHATLVITASLGASAEGAL